MTAAPKVYMAINTVMAHMSKEGIAKDRRSGDGGGPRFVFRGIDDIYNALSSVMADAKLMMLPRVLERSNVERATKNGGVMFYTTVKVEFDLVSAEDGSKHTVVTFGEAMDTSDKSTNKAMSAAFKYAAMQAFCIPTEGDNDADAATHEVVPQQRQDGNDKPMSADNVEAKAMIAWVDTHKAKFAAMDGAPGQDACDTLISDPDFIRDTQAIRKANPSLFAELKHAKDAAIKRCAETPF